jgi:drug/metabolite transporter (DMT)-like permease
MSNSKTPKLRIYGVLIALLGAIAFSTKAVFVKLAYQYGIDSVTLLMFRMLFSLPFYVIIAFWAFRRPVSTNQTKPTWKDYLIVVVLGILGYYLASYLDFEGLKYISASLERLILFSYPTFVVILSAILFREKIKQNQLLALIFTYIGIAVVFIFNVEMTSQNDLFIGSFLVFLCAISFAFYVVGTGRVLHKFGTWRYTSLVMIVSAIGVLTHYAIDKGGIGNLNYPIEVYIFSVLMAIISTVVASLLTSEGIRLIGATNSAIVASVGPISTITMAYIFLDERLTWMQILGGIFVIFGVLFITLERKKKVSSK